MYVRRPAAEKALLRSVRKNTHSILFGASGNGKSWLYKKVLAEVGIPFRIANCANASRQRSITQEICSVLVDDGASKKTGYTETKNAGVSAYFASGSVEHSGNYDTKSSESLLHAFEQYSKKHNGEKILVLDNFERIFSSEELMSELADLIILLDDQRYAQHSVTMLIVGTPTDVLDYFGRLPNFESVANRLEELPEVGGLTPSQVNEIISSGFNDLGISYIDGHLDHVVEHIYKITLGIAQRVHEYGEVLAYVVEDNDWTLRPEQMDVADKKWLDQSLRQCYAAVESHLNSRETEVARRNQAIYVIGNRITSHSFNSGDIDVKIQKEFPSTVPNTHMGIGTILAGLASGASPLVRILPNSKEYTICDPRYLMCIRAMLYKESQTQKVKKKKFRA